MPPQPGGVRIFVHLGKGHTRTRETNDKRHILRLRGGNWRHPSALTVSPKTNLPRIDIGAPFQHLDSSECVSGQVAKVDSADAISIAALVALVIDERRNASASEEIAVKPKIVAIGRAGTVNQNYSRMMRLARRKEQGAGKPDAAIGKAHL